MKRITILIVNNNALIMLISLEIFESCILLPRIINKLINR
jgi:hypothetical protein